MDIYIGNSATYSENELCTPTPLLSATYDDIDSSWAGSGVPAYGFLQWCNMSGTYTHIVFTDVPLVDMSICNVGIFGTFFYRENLPESTVEIPAGNTLTLEVEHIKASLEYAHSLDINLRQSSSSANLPFVTFTNKATSTEVIINTEGLSSGEHTLALESFDDSGSVKSTLKADYIQIVITEAELEALEVQSDSYLDHNSEILELVTIFEGNKLVGTLPSTKVSCVND